jgi:glycerol uptake operon antiterminator
LDFLTILRKRPVIAAFREIKNLRFQELNHIDIILILGQSIFDLPQIVKLAKAYKKFVFVDIDLLKGIGKDAEGIRFLAKESKVDGVITTHRNLIKSIKQEGLFSIQRIFVLDSESIEGGINSILKSNPDAVDILPGLILPKIAKKIRVRTSIPLIAGGLITGEEEIREILASGAIGISTTDHSLFNFSAKS